MQPISLLFNINANFCIVSSEYVTSIVKMNFVVSFLSFRRFGLLLALLLGGCAFHPMTPRGVSDIGDILPFGSQTTPIIVQNTTPSASSTPAQQQTLLSPGDNIKLSIFGDEHFSGQYVINQNGMISVPFLGQIAALGITPDALRITLVDRFISERYFKQHLLRLAVEVIEWAPAQVSVAGAVYQPGQVVINQYTDRLQPRPTELRSGAATVKRFVQDAILAAGGLRPDADLNNIRIQRNEQHYQISLLDFFNGTDVANIGLITGDRVVIGSIGVFQEPLARPSSFTAPGFRVYLSNLTTPALSNASSSVGRDSTRLPTGARLSHAIASANCFGGTPIINANRRVKYVTRNPLTATITSHIYNVEEVMQRADETLHNPYLQPEDQLGCYEGPVTILREAARTAYDLVSPALGIEILRNAVND